MTLTLPSLASQHLCITTPARTFLSACFVAGPFAPFLYYRALSISHYFLHTIMHLTSLPVLFLTLVIACPTLAATTSWHTHAAISRTARAFSIRSGCKIVSKPDLCDAVQCFRLGGRCDIVMEPGRERGRCFPHVMLSNGRLAARQWGVGIEPRQCDGCKCEALPGVRNENGGAKEENMGGTGISHDADFHRFLKEVVLREPPSPKRQKVSHSSPSLRRP